MQILRRLIVVVLLALLANGPALALSPSAFQVLFSGGWWLPGASVDMNFASGQYYGCDISCVSVARASSKTNLLPTSASGFAYSTFANNVPAIDGNGLLPEEARTNQLLNSTAPVTQTTASLGTGAYTLWVNGSGSAQMSSGTGTGCGTGTATNGTPVNFTITIAGTCTVTKTGSLNAFQLEAGAFGTSLIVTAGATATRAADNISAAGALQTVLFGTAGSIIAQLGGVVDTSVARVIVSLNTRLTLGTNSNTTQIRAIDNNNANSVAATLGSAAVITSMFKGALSWDGSGRSLVAKNGTVATNANGLGATTTSATVSQANSTSLDSYLQRLTVFNTRLPDATLKALTQ